MYHFLILPDLTRNLIKTYINHGLSTVFINYIDFIRFTTTLMSNDLILILII